MTGDIIDQQARAREQIRRLEIGPPVQTWLTPTPWDPAYGPQDEITLIAYAMLPFCAFLPAGLPALPPIAQDLAFDVIDGSFPDKYISRAFMRALLCARGIVLPGQITANGSYLQRCEGQYTDPAGANWRSQPGSRAVRWESFTDGAMPPGGSYAWQLSFEPSPPLPAGADFHYPDGHPGNPNYPDPTSPPRFNYPGTAAWKGHPQNQVNGSRTYNVTVDGAASWYGKGTAGYQPGSDTFPCGSSNLAQFAPYGEWEFGGADPTEGVIKHFVKSSAPLCYPKPGQPENINSRTEVGYWVLAWHQLDALAALYWTRPPAPYQGEDYCSFERSSSGQGALIQYPGFTDWVNRIVQWGYGTPDWVDNVRGWLRSQWPRLSQPGTPGEHWQRMPVYLPWRGKLEYRIWQRILYLRGNLENIYYWSDQRVLAPLPPGVTPIKPDSGHPASGNNSVPYSVEANNTLLLLSDYVDTDPRHNTPPRLNLDTVRIPVQVNPPFVP